MSEIEMEGNDSDIELTGETLINMSDEQDDHVRRVIRRQYRDLTQETQSKMEKLAETGPLDVKNLIEKADSLFNQVTKTREAALDSQQLHMCAQIAKHNTESLSANLTDFRPLEFAEKLIRHLGNRMESNISDDEAPDIIPANNWIQFGTEVMPMFKKAPSFHFMYGSFGANEVPQQRKRQVRAKDDEATRAVVPKEVNKINKSEQETTTEEVQRILGILKYLYEKNGRDPLCYFQFVTDPDSFGHTVENIFHVSFLVKDGLVSIDLDEHGLPVIAPIDEKQQQENSGKEANQFVMTLTMDDWKETVEALQIKKPYIPHKEYKK